MIATEQDVAKVKVDWRTSVYSAYNVIAGPLAPIFASGYRTNSHFLIIIYMVVCLFIVALRLEVVLCFLPQILTFCEIRAHKLFA